MSQGKRERLEYIQRLLGLDQELPLQIRYQLLHRTASAVLEALRFNASSAVIIVHSFNQDNLWFEDFQAFLQLFGVQAQLNKLLFLRETKGVKLYAGWAKGDARFLVA